jgi:hypothetical protein
MKPLGTIWSSLFKSHFRQPSCNAKSVRVFGCLLVALLLSFVSHAQTPDPNPPGPSPDPARPPLIPLPQLENWSFLKGRSKRTDKFDPIKYIALGSDSYLSLGNEYRMEYERYTASNFGEGPQDQNGYLLVRELPHFDVHATNHFRFYNEFQFDYVEWRNGGPRSGIDEDRGDVHQSFVDFGTDVRSGRGFLLRAGRQEIVFGRGRFLDNNEGTNVKISFDGFTAGISGPKGSLDIFAVKPVTISPGFFDDAPAHGKSLWGLYGNNLPLGGPKADLYYIGWDIESASYSVGTGREIRHTVGGRIDQAIGEGIDFDWESAFQWGAFTDRSIHAYTVQTETGYTFSQVPGHIRPFLRFDVASGSGSSDPNGHSLGTFNSLFPRGAYITPKMAPPFAIVNVIDVHPMTWFQPFAHVETSIGWDWFWRYSTGDGLYGLSGLPVRGPTLDGRVVTDRYIGQLGDMEIRWSPVGHLIFAFNFAGMINGAYLKHSGTSHNITYINSGITYRF